MPKPDPALLDASRYPFRYGIEPRFADLDVNHHLNNVAIIGLMQEGRIRLHERYAGLPDSRSFALVVARLEVDFLADGAYPDSLEIFCAIDSIGRTSHGVRQLMLQNGKPVAVLHTIMVRTDKGAKMENDSLFTAALSAWTIQR